MPASDPLTETRRRRFQELCRDKRWYDDQRGQWLITDISAATLKPRNKVSDLLNGKGSFGSKIAREIEAALEIAPYSLESAEDLSEGDPKMAHARFEPLQRATVLEAVEVIGESLLGLDELGLQMAEPILRMLLSNPADASDLGTELQRLVEARKRTPPNSPRGGAKKERATQPARKQAGNAKLSVKVGGGQKSQLDLPLRKGLREVLVPAADPFDESSAPANERKWYAAVGNKPKASDSKKP